MNKLPEYSNYTSTNIDWIRKYPSHWQLIPCRAVVDHIVEKNEGGKIQNYLSLMANVGVIRYEDKGDIGNKKPEDLSKCKIVKKGQLVINSMNYSIGSYGMSPYNGVCSSVYIILEPKNNLLNRYGLRVFENSAFQKHLATFGNGILAHRAAIGWDDIKGEYIPLAPKDEQEKILNFLDHETAQIDTLIEKQQTLIQLLKEKRQAVISHAVTKGLNPDAPMKDSGVEWLGEVPEHWEVTKLGFHTSKIGSGKTPRGGAEVYQEEGVLFIRSQNVYDSGLRIDKSESVFISEVIHEEMSNTKVQGGDVLLNITGGSIGRTCIVPNNFIEANVNQHVCIVRLPISMRYFIAFILKSSLVKEQIDSIQTGGNREGLNFEQISKFAICLPPEEERADIVSYIETETKKIDSLLEQSNNAIQLMQERRTALISAAVTGKIDVRGWVAPDNI
ncbi:restriction endonuclease subunit S [Psychrobacter pacificensis]|uniref:restriction endonuclease subunit S n=1 Tax=Psychrobacter pacificensis TaxID=112002 RepID=UPI003D03F214